MYTIKYPNKMSATEGSKARQGLPNTDIMFQGLVKIYVPHNSKQSDVSKKQFYGLTSNYLYNQLYTLAFFFHFFFCPHINMAV